MQVEVAWPNGVTIHEIGFQKPCRLEFLGPEARTLGTLTCWEGLRDT